MAKNVAKKPAGGMRRANSATPNSAYWIAAQTGRVVGKAEGYPGAAKTASVEAFGRAIGRPVYTLIGSLREPADVGGYPSIQTQVIEGKETVYMALVPPKYAVDSFDGQDWIIFIDELTCCPPAVQAALLRVIAEKIVGDLPLPANTWILSACNPPNIAAGGFELEPPMANRLYHHDWEYDWDAFSSGLRNGGVFPAPKFPILPEDWMNWHSKVGASFAAFQTRRPEVFLDYPKDRAKAGGAWGSPRSWFNGSLLLAAGQSVGADKDLQSQLLRGAVGASADEYFEWERNLDLPDPRMLLAEAIRAQKAGEEMHYDHPDRPDKVIAMIGSLTHEVLQNNTTERWQAAMSVVEQAAMREVDVALAGVGPLTRARPKDADLSDDFVKKLYPVLQRSGSFGQSAA